MNQTCVENQCRKSYQFFLPPGLGFNDILASQNRSKIISKSLKIVLAPKKRHRAPPKASKKAPEASAAATGCLPKLPKTAPRSLKRVKVIRQFTLVYSLQWTQISHTRKSRCQFTVHRLWSVPDCSRLTIRCSRFSVSRLPSSASFRFRMPKRQDTAHSYSQISNSARPKKQERYNTHRRPFEKWTLAIPDYSVRDAMQTNAFTCTHLHMHTQTRAHTHTHSCTIIAPKQYGFLLRFQTIEAKFRHRKLKEMNELTPSKASILRLIHDQAQQNQTIQ